MEIKVGDTVKLKPDFFDLSLGGLRDPNVTIDKIEDGGRKLPLIHFTASCGFEGKFFAEAFEAVF